MPQTNKNKVAVLLAAYNGEEFIREQMISLSKQTYPHFTCYIHDDESSDGTVSCIEESRLLYTDHFNMISGIRQGGAKQNFTYLLEQIDSEYYMFCDQDDEWKEDKIEKTVKRMQEEEKKTPGVPVCVYTDLEVVDDSLHTISPSFFSYMHLDPYKNSLQDLLFKNICYGCTIMINRCMREELLKIIKKDCFMIHDWPCACIAAAEGSLCYIDDALIKYRQHGNNTVGAAKELPLVNKFSRAIKDITGFLERKRFYIERPREMAAALLELSLLDEETRAFLSKFSEIKRKNKIERIAFYIDNKLFRQGENKVWELLWI